MWGFNNPFVLCNENKTLAQYEQNVTFIILINYLQYQQLSKHNHCNWLFAFFNTADICIYAYWLYHYMLIKSNPIKCLLWLKVDKSIELPYLCFSQHKRCGHFKAFRSGQVFVKLELVLQLQQLLAGECSARPPALAQQAGLRARCSTQDKHTVVWGENSSAVTTQVT